LLPCPAERYCCIFEQSSTAMLIVSPQGIIQAANPAAASVFEYSREELAGLPLDQLIVCREEFDRRIGPVQVDTQDPTRASVVQYRSKSGKVFPGETAAAALTGSDGAATGNFYLVRDISFRRHIEQRLRTLATAVESVGEAVVLTDDRGVIQYVNPAFEEITGYGRNEAAGHTPRLLKSGKHDHEFYQRGWEKLTSGQVWRTDFINRKKDGTLYHAMDTIAPVRDPLGKVIGFVGVQRDETERLRLEAEVRRYALVYKNMADGVAAFDSEGRVCFCNPAMVELTGRSPGDLLKQTPELWGGGPPDLSSSEPSSGREEVVRRPGGSERIVSVRFAQLQCEPPLCMAIYRDITREKEAESRLREAQREKEQFYRFIMHDIIKPLAAIAGFAGKLAESGGLSPRDHQRADHILSAAKRLQEIVQRQLEVEQLDRGSISLRFETYDLLAHLRDLTVLLAEKRPELAIRIQGRTIDEARALPPIHVASDAVQLGRVFQNLIDNAISYAASAIEMQIEVFEEEIRFSIWNDGLPIAPEIQDRLFDEFYRAPGETRSGFGIGLASTRKLLRLLGGAIRLECPAAGGARFLVRLPRRFTPGISSEASSPGLPSSDSASEHVNHEREKS